MVSSAASRIRNTAHVLTRKQLKMCKAIDSRSVRYTNDDVVIAALKFLEKLDHVEVKSPTNRIIKSDGSFKIEEEEAHRLDGPEKDYHFAKLYLRDETSSPVALVLLEYGRTYRKSDLYAAFTTSMKHVEPIYVTQDMECGDCYICLWPFGWFGTFFVFLILCLVVVICTCVCINNKS
jgi:hypothetical protein